MIPQNVEQETPVDQVLKWGRYMDKESAKLMDRSFRVMCVGMAVLAAGVARAIVIEVKR